MLMLVANYWLRCVKDKLDVLKKSGPNALPSVRVLASSIRTFAYNCNSIVERHPHGNDYSILMSLFLA